MRGDTLSTALVMLGLARLGSPFLFPFEGRAEDEIPGRPSLFEIHPRNKRAPPPSPSRRTLWMEELTKVGENGDSTPLPPMPAPDAGLMVLSTSGTTGKPKSFMMTQAHVMARSRQLERNFGLGSDSRFLLDPGLQSAVGRRMLLNVLAMGGTVVLVGSISRTGITRLMHAKKVNFALMTPAHLREMLEGDLPSSPALPDTVIGVTSAPFTQDLYEMVERTLTPRLHDVYGTNETGILTLTSGRDRAERPGTVGRAAVGVELEIVDEAGRPLPRGQVGEIRCRSEGFPPGYLGGAETSGRYFREGWFHPGDMGTLDDQGYLFLRGRSDEVINNQGMKFYPVQVENVLRTHPEVKDVVVIGVDDPVYTQYAVAIVVLRKSIRIDELWNLLFEKLPLPMKPRWILPVARIERTPAGKVVREAARRIVEERIARDLPSRENDATH